MKQICIFILWLNFYYQASAQKRDTLVHRYLQTILSKQVVADTFFKSGSFPTFRQYANSKKFKEDNTIFYTALIHFTINELKPLLTLEEKIIADTICNRIAKAYPFYKNPKPRGSYNFWPFENGQKTFFPNQGWFSKMSNSLALPDDIDDTGIILINSNITKQQAQQLHDSTQLYINGKHSWAKNTLSQFKKLPAYSTWYGIKMPIEFDFGAHCNYLYFANYYQINKTPADEATLQLVNEIIRKNYHVNNSFHVSPYYYNPINILYHTARLGSKFNVFDDDVKAKIIDQLNNYLQKETVPLNKILVATSLLKFKQPLVNFNDDFINKLNLHTTDFVFFKNYIMAHLGNAIKKMAGNTSLSQFNWFCSAFNDCLVLEYLVLKRNANVY